MPRPLGGVVYYRIESCKNSIVTMIYDTRSTNTSKLTPGLEAALAARLQRIVL